MRSLLSCAVIGVGSFVVFAGSAAAVDEVDKIAFWGQNDNVLGDGSFGFDDNSFPQPADNGVGNGFLTTTFSSDWIQSFAGTTLGWPDTKGDPDDGGSISFQGGTLDANGIPMNNGETFTLNFDASQFLSVTLSFARRGTATGFNNVVVAGGTDSHQIFGSPTSFELFVFDFDSLAGNPNAEITFTLNGATSAVGNNRYDNILLTGKIPTPGAAALFAIAGLAGARRRRA